MAIASVTAIGAFVQKCFAFKREMNEVLAGLGDGSQFKSFTEETGAQLQNLFSRIPALAFCYQTYFQALIPPQPPYDNYYRSGREALYSFDRDFILKTSLGLRFFQSVPAILIALGALGTIIGFAGSLSSTQALLASSNPGNLTELARQLFEVGGKSFWPAGIGIFGGIALLITERMMTSQCSDMIQALAMVLDGGMSPRTIEQIASTSLTELRETHKAITDFTKGYYQNLSSHMGKLVTKGGQITVEELLEMKAKDHLLPLAEDLKGIRDESLKAAETSHKLLADKVLVLDQRMMESVDVLKSTLNKMQDSLVKSSDTLSQDQLSKLEWVVAEVQALAKDKEMWTTDSFSTLLGAIQGVASAVRGDLGSISQEFSSSFNGIDLPGIKRELSSELAARLTAQAEITQSILLELRDSSALMSADIHQAARVLEENLAPDMGRQSKLLQEITDRVAMQGNKLTETVLSVGEDLAHRVDLVSTVLVGEEAATGENASPFVQEVREKLTQYSPNVAYGTLRNRIEQMNIDRRIKEGESQRIEDRAQVEAEKRVITRQGLFERIGTLESQIREQRDVLSNETAAVGSAIASTLGDHLSSQSQSLKDGLGESNQKLHGDVAYLSQKIDSIAEKLEEKLEKIGKKVGNRIAEFGDRVSEELHTIGEDVDTLAYGGRKLDHIARDLQDLGEYLEEIPLSTIQVVQNGRHARSAYDYQDSGSHQRRSRNEQGNSERNGSRYEDPSDRPRRPRSTLSGSRILKRRPRRAS